MKRFRILKVALVLLACLILASGILVKFFLVKIASSEEFKRFAEEKVGEYLQAKVSIGGIRPYRFNQIALENIIIEAPSAQSGSQLVRMDRLLFRYHLSQLWKRQFINPVGVVLRNPSVVIEQDQFPYRYFENFSGGPGGLGIPSLDFKGGEIRYRLPSIGKDIVLTNIEGKISPSEEGKVLVDIRARARGVLEGGVTVQGVVDPLKNSHDLSLELDHVDFTKDIPLPLQAISGKVRWTGKDLFFEGVKASFHGWDAEISGSFENMGGNPKTTLNVQIGKEKPWFATNLVLNLTEQRLAGSFQAMDQPRVDFEGKVRVEGKRFIVDSLTANEVYQAKAEFNLATGNYEVAVEKGTKRITVFSNLRGLDLAIHASLDHLYFLGLDIVTDATLYLHAISSDWERRQFHFKGNLETNYFILNQQPFQDLKGSFDVSPYGVTGVNFTWGGKFQLTGQVVFPLKKPQAKLTLRVANFDLGQVQFFASKPLPKEMGGMLDGKVLIQGDLKKPEVTAAFNIRDGKWGKVDYDRGIIQFRGFPPYFPLEGSKIWRGRSVYFLQGAVDLALDNIVAGVKIETPDSLVVWKGLEVTLHEKEGNVQLQHKGAGKGSEFSPLEVAAIESSVGGQDDQSDESVENKGVVIGPKLKF